MIVVMIVAGRVQNSEPGGSVEVMEQNARNAGLTPGVDCEVREVTPEEFAAMIQPTPAEARVAEILAELARLDMIVSREGEEFLACLEAAGQDAGIWPARKTARNQKVALRLELAQLRG